MILRWIDLVLGWIDVVVQPLEQVGEVLDLVRVPVRQLIQDQVSAAVQGLAGDLIAGLGQVEKMGATIGGVGLPAYATVCLQLAQVSRHGGGGESAEFGELGSASARLQLEGPQDGVLALLKLGIDMAFDRPEDGDKGVDCLIRSRS